MQLTLNPSDYKPRLIIWEIACSCYDGTTSINSFTTQECFTIMDSISEVSKPIIVLASNQSEQSKCDPLDRSDIIDILLYGNSIGLKMIVETCGDKLSDELMQILRTIGTKCIRLLITDQIKEDVENKFLSSEKYKKLNDIIDKLKKANFEIQLGIPLKNFNEREISFIVDYAVLMNAKGIYFHLMNSKTKTGKQSYNKEQAINWIAKQKRLLPNGMYFSPQCVRYENKHQEDSESDHLDNHSKLVHCCLSGKTFSYINGKGEVQICNSLKHICGDLRKSNLSFAQIWYNSEIYNWLRYNNYTCLQTQNIIKKSIQKSSESKELTKQT